MVLQAGDQNSPFRQQALADLLQAYWYPLYGYIRRQGYQADAAEDLLQAFMANILEKNSFRSVREGQGRFRNFILVCLRNFLASESERTRALKRGGNAQTLSLDFNDANARYQLEPSHNVTAERLFERDWALDIIEKAFARLAADWAQSGKQLQFQVLSKYLSATRPAPSYAEAAAQLGATEGAVKTAVHRLRGQFRQILCDEVFTTLGNDDLLEDEIRHLFSALAV
jgi:RNA polymerase sigma-70 factor (ECF subfamily)